LFALGAESFLIQQFTEAAVRSGRQVTAHDVFEQQTIRGLAAITAVCSDDPVGLAHGADVDATAAELSLIETTMSRKQAR
jgi:hypothetical protein